MSVRSPTGSNAGDNVTKFAVLGSGCIGSCVGIALAAAGYDVTFVGRSSDKFSAVEQRKWMSLTWPEPKAAPYVLKTESITSDAERGLSSRNVILVATKRTANEAAARNIAQYAPQGAVVVMLQNGLEPSKDVTGIFQETGRSDLIVLDCTFYCMRCNQLLLITDHSSSIYSRRELQRHIHGTRGVQMDIETSR